MGLCRPEYLAPSSTDIACGYFMSGVYISRSLGKALVSHAGVVPLHTSGREFACSQLASLGRPAGEAEERICDFICMRGSMCEGMLYRCKGAVKDYTMGIALYCVLLCLVAMACLLACLMA